MIKLHFNSTYARFKKEMGSKMGRESDKPGKRKK